MTSKEERAERILTTIRNSIEAGFTLTEVVRMLLGESFADFSKANGVSQTEISMCLLGYPGRDLPKVRKLLARKLGLRLSVMNNVVDTYRYSNTTTNEISATKK